MTDEKKKKRDFGVDEKKGTFSRILRNHAVLLLDKLSGEKKKMERFISVEGTLVVSWSVSLFSWKLVFFYLWSMIKIKQCLRSAHTEIW